MADPPKPEGAPRPHRPPRRNHFIRLTLGGMDELAMFPTPQSRQEALDGFPKSIGARDMVLGGAAIIVVVAVLVTASKLALRWLPASGSARELLDFLPFLAGLTGLVFALRFLHRRGAATFLRERLIESGVPVCARCGYALRGLPPDTAACPECGRSLDAWVRALLDRAGDAQMAPTAIDGVKS